MKNKFLFAGNLKENVVTGGVLITFCIFIAIFLRLAYAGGYAVYFAILNLLIPVLILKGVKFGYIIAKLIFGGIALLLIAGVVNPFAYEEIRFGKIPYTDILIVVLLIDVLLGFLFYCLREHAKMRNAMRGHP